MSVFLDRAARPLLLGKGRALLLGAGPADGTTGSSGATVNALFIGQSNANYAWSDGAWSMMAQGAAWYLGAGTSAGTAYGGPSQTLLPGEGLYSPIETGVTGSFLDNPGDGSDPSTWSFGSPDGAALTAYLASLTPAQRASINAICLPWSESDSYRPYSQKAQYKAAAARFLALLRQTLGKTAAQLPALWWGIVFGNTDGWAMQQEAIAELAADPAQNVIIGVPQPGDSVWRDAAYNPFDGTFSGGSDYIHRAAIDNVRFGQRGAILLARAIQQAQNLPALWSGLPQVGGPSMVAARLSGLTVTVTVQHDAGNDLRLPLQARNGYGFAVLDGIAISAAGTVGSAIPAVAAAYVNPTTFTLTLAQTPTNQASACRLFYPFRGVASTGSRVGRQDGINEIGRGDAITDNYSAIAKPVSADIAAALGPSAAAWGFDYPLQRPVTVSGGVASAGLALS